jgi:hypothetical protein
MRSNTLYLLGSGFNKYVEDWDNLKPPTALDFFRLFLQSKKVKDDYYRSKVSDVFEYIELFWKKTIDDLMVDNFNLEDCFTLIEYHLNQAINKNDTALINKMVKVSFNLKAMFAEFLQDFESFVYNSETLLKFGRKLYAEKSSVLTFNYDCILESVIESASGVNISFPRAFLASRNERMIPVEELRYSHFNWNRLLSYGVKFDMVQLQRAGVGKYERAERFYSAPGNELYENKLLKLHGSLNWFKYLYPLIPELTVSVDRSEILALSGHWHFGMPPMLGTWIMDPIMITPILYKDRFYNEDLFLDLWEQAKVYLSQCKKLVIIGYSFPSTDFNTKRLFLESFANNKLEELIVVNPDSDARKIPINLTHYEGDAREFNYLDEYLKSDL